MSSRCLRSDRWVSDKPFSWSWITLWPVVRSRRRCAPRLTAVHVRCQDAGTVDSFADLLPVDVLMLCGIFGNVEHAQVKAIIDVVPRLVTRGGFVIWTRGCSEPDHRAEVRHWFELAGLEEIAFAGAPEPYGIGLNRSTLASPPTGAIPDRLFMFE
jgi:hypothetical protein